MAISPSVLSQSPIPGLNPTLGLNPGQIPVVPGLNTALPNGVNPSALFSAPFPGVSPGLNQVPVLPGINTPLPGGVMGATLLSPSSVPQSIGLQQLSALQQPAANGIPLSAQIRQQPIAVQQPKAEAAEETRGPGKGKGKGKGKIPPGLAKKDPSSLPEGNPWRAILEQQQKEQEQKQQTAQQPAVPRNAQMQPVLSPLMGGAQQVPVLIPIQIQ